MARRGEWERSLTPIFQTSFPVCGLETVFLLSWFLCCIEGLSLCLILGLVSVLVLACSLGTVTVTVTEQ